MKIIFQHPDREYQIEWTPNQPIFNRMKKGVHQDYFTYYHAGGGFPPTLDQAFDAAEDDFLDHG